MRINSAIRSAFTLLVLVSLLAGCDSEELKITGQQFELQVLEQNGLRKDHSMDSTIKAVLPGINCLAGTVSNHTLVLADDFLPSDTSQIVVIPFTTGLEEYGSSAYSDIKNRFIIVNPSRIISFTEKVTLNGSASANELLSLMLLHEVGHFVLGISGAFDAAVSGNHTSGLPVGEMKMDTAPEYLTTLKRGELEVDSIATSVVKDNVLATDISCNDCAGGIQRILPGISFQLFGIRLPQQFGNPVKILRDPNSSPPNMELRIAFMNYYLFPTDERKQMIDEYLYDREVAPIKRQESDPRIFQGQEKLLREDK